MKNGKKILSLCCTTALVVSLAGVSYGAENGMKKSLAADTKEIETIEEALEEFEDVTGVATHSDTAGKEETVYAIMSADGKVQQTIVSEWLKNPEGKTSLTDQTELSDIKVVKGDAEYKQGASKDQIVWSGDGSDIYYQGNSEKELPVEVKISYELDGKKVSAEELSGASGHLKMTFTYINRISKTVKIGGEMRTIYQPFTMISGMLMDNSKAQNVTVDSGSVVNSGDDTLVFGIAMPGLAESLGLEDMDLEIPEKVTVEADVTDFSLMMTLTAASNTALSQLGIDDMDSIDDLKADMDQLTSGMSEIVDGASKLNEGADDLSAGVAELDTGVSDLKNGVEVLSSKTPALVSGASALAMGASDLTSGMNELLEYNEELNTGAEALADGLAELNGAVNKDTAKQQITALTSGSKTFSEGISNASAGLTKIVNGYSYNSGNLSALIAGLEQYAQGLENAGDATNAAYIRQMIATYKAFYNDVATASQGVGALSTSYAELNQGIAGAAGSLAEISDAATDLSDGANDLKEGVSFYTAGVKKALDGAIDLQSGLNSLNEKVPALVSGVKELSIGSSKLKKGTESLSAGTEELVSGTGDLKEGIVTFDKEGIQKLAKIVNEDLETYYDRFKALQDFAEEYTSYAGCEEGVECSVKFIYKTDGIE